MRDLSAQWLTIHIVIWVASATTAIVLGEAEVMIAPVVGSAVALTASGHIKW